MRALAVTAQLRTTHLEASIAFYTRGLGLELAFRYGDFYAGIRAGAQLFHLKRSDAADPSIPFVRDGEHFHLYLDVDDVDAAASTLRARGIVLRRDAQDTPWGTREIVLEDDQGHTIYIGENRRSEHSP